MSLIVKKFGGATLSDPEKIKAIAKSLSDCHKRGEQLVVVVSAMGQTTNELIDLAHKISSKPKRREMDMLLSTGERISMSLLSMALNELQCPAISFTGSQAGVFTDDSHLNAFITDVQCPRVKDAIQKNNIAILAGFQGVSPTSKEVTTLGRGGTDTTAVAISIALKASHCEILKDVSGVYSADPKICPTAKHIQQLSYEEMLDLTFWGAKVLHYRSVELALRENVSIYIGPAHNHQIGTWIKKKENIMFEQIKILSINSHSEVLWLTLKKSNLAEGLEQFKKDLISSELSSPQLLSSETTQNGTKIFISGPSEILSSIKQELSSYEISNLALSSVTATCSGASTPEIVTQISKKLSEEKIFPLRVWMSPMSTTVLVPSEQRTLTISTLHQLI